MALFTIIKRTLVISIILILAFFAHYTLPRNEVVRIVGATERLETFGINRFFFSGTPGGMAAGESRDVRYIDTVRPSGEPRVFRNEDTGFWPPFLKFDAADLQARARDQVSDADDPKWIRVRYYGIRSQLFTIFPNALNIRRVDGPDDTAVPWTRMISFIAILGFGLWLWLRLRVFGAERVAPALDRASERTGAVRAFFGRIRRLFSRR